MGINNIPSTHYHLVSSVASYRAAARKDIKHVDKDSPHDISEAYILDISPLSGESDVDDRPDKYRPNSGANALIGKTFSEIFDETLEERG